MSGRLGGSGICKFCGKYDGNVSYHEGIECPKRPFAQENNELTLDLSVNPSYPSCEISMDEIISRPGAALTVTTRPMNPDAQKAIDKVFEDAIRKQRMGIRGEDWFQKFLFFVFGMAVIFYVVILAIYFSDQWAR